MKQLKTYARKIKTEITAAMLSLLVLPNRMGFGGLNTQPRHPKITVSLTSIPPRLPLVHLVIESIFRQTVKPDRIVLLLSKEYKRKELGGFDRENLPRSLTELQRRGMKILFTEDIGSYGKLIPSIRRFPDDIVITIDDDVFYHSDTIEKLYEAYLLNGRDFIYCRRSKIMETRSGGGVEPYGKWRLSFSPQDNGKPLFFTGTGAVLYPPRIFSDEVFNQDAFLELAPFADDVWFNAMGILNGKSVFQVEGKEPVRLGTAKSFSLSQRNLHGEENDAQIKAVFERYNLYPKL